MIAIHDGVTMAKKKVKEPVELDERVTVLNLKGSVKERDYLKNVSRITGVPAAEIARRGIAMWIVKRDVPPPPSDWMGV